jgi:hypothetical protein
LVGFVDFVSGDYTTIDPKNQRFEPTMTMHYYTTIDKKNLKRFESTTMHYTTIDPKIQRFEPTTMPHCTTIAPPKKKVRDTTNGGGGINYFEINICWGTACPPQTPGPSYLKQDKLLTW